MEWFKVDFLTIIAITGIVQGLFLSSALLTTKRGEQLVNRMLVCLLSIFLLDILFSSVSAISFLRIDHCLRFLYGPVLFFIMKVLRFHSFHFRKKDIIHLLPFSISFLFIIPVTFFTPGMIIHLHGFMDMIKVLFSFVVFIQLSSYLFYCYRKMAGQEKNGIIVNKKDLSIHEILIFTCFIYNILCLMSSVGKIFIINNDVLVWLPPLFVTFIIYFFGYISILKPGLLFITWDKENNHSVYKKLHLSEQNSKEYLNRLFLVMKKEKLYTDPDLTLPLLADRVHISRNLLSHLLNSILGINFYDFINGFRIKAVKNLLADNSLENESILTIAFNAGFNSKSAFNKIFKKHTNMSPSQYKKISMNKKKETKIFSHIMELDFIENLENGYGIKSICSGTS
ncbi:MAG: AraC family transcriptional regulator [Spirochaetales bacterium]|nr:AraC family transcriptional regulator [Spirochaetales bacterium]